MPQSTNTTKPGDTPWRKKLTVTQKKHNTERRQARRRRIHPTRAELRHKPDAIATFVKDRKMGKHAQKRLMRLLEISPYNTEVDWRDLRRVAPSDRVPRSLEDVLDPQGFWDIAI